MDNALNYYSGDQFSSEVWKKKYAQPGESSPVDMHLRMAKEFARVRFKKDQSKTYDEWVDYFFDLFDRFQKTIPQGRVMAGVGSNGTYRSLSNCLRLPPPNDSYSSIMKVDTMLVNSAKRGCGYGVGLSKLRPKGAATKNSSRTSTGTVLFGERFSNSTKEVGQEGRRGACLLDLDIRHPDSPEFATVKMDKTKLTGANISFKVRKDFLDAVKNDKDYILRFPVDVELAHNFASNPAVEYDVLHTCPDENGNPIYYKKVRAKELWDSAIHTVWAEGCPGLQFWDEIVNFDPSSVYEKYRIDGTNACGEQPMAAFDTCRLLTLMLLACVKNPFTKNAEIDYNLLYEYSYIQMEVGDDLIDLEIEHIEKIIAKIISDPEDDTEKAIELELWTKVLDMAKSGRRVGGGITALADMLAALNIKYDSDKALYTVDQVMRTKFEAELNANMDLAEKYGTFEGWNPELEYRGNDWYKWLEWEFPNEFRRMQKVGRRFINWNTIAPVGTTSAITLAIKYPGVSSGCEPSFGCYHFRNKKVENDIDPYDFIDEVGIKWKQFPVIMGAFKDWIEINTNRLFKTEDEVNFDALTPDMLRYLYEQSPWFGCLAQDIDWKKRIEMQAILQKYTTSAISSTINLPNDATEKTISDIYMYAAEKGLKGITCYRDGSKGGVLVHTKKEVVVEGRPKSLQAKFYPTVIKGKKFAIIVGIHNNTPYEVFAFADPIQHEACTGEVIREKKGVYSFKSENGDIPNLELAPDHADEIIIGRFVSGLLKHGATIEFIVDQINKTPLTIPSFGKAISRVLKTYIKDDVQTGSQCPECSSYLVYEEGCKKCKSCGYSAC